MSLLDHPRIDDDRNHGERTDADESPLQSQGTPATTEIHEIDLRDDTDRPSLDRATDDRATDDSATGAEDAETETVLERLLIADGVVIDINENRIDLADRPTAVLPPPATTTALPAIDAEIDGHGETAPHTAAEANPDESEPTVRKRSVRGLRLRRVRLRSVLKVGLVFFAVAYATIVGTAVLMWNAAQRLGLIGDLEGAVTSALGTDTFAVVGSDLFDVVAVGAAALCVLGLVVTVLLAIVYNITGVLFGGLAFETAPLQQNRARSTRSTR